MSEGQLCKYDVSKHGIHRLLRHGFIRRPDPLELLRRAPDLQGKLRSASIRQQSRHRIEEEDTERPICRRATP